MKKYLFDNDKRKYDVLQTELRNYAKNNNLLFEEMKAEDNKGWMCQMMYKQFNKLPSANDTATTIIFRELSEETLELEIGKGKWGVKAWFAVAGIGMMNPLSLLVVPLAAVGARKQQKQTKEVMELIRRKLSLKEL